MHTLRNRILFFGAAVMAGLSSLVLHQYMLEHCFDARGLLIAGNLPGKLLWVVAIGFAAYLLPLLTTIGGDGDYADNFPRSLLSGVLMLTAGGALLAAVRQLGLEQSQTMELVDSTIAVLVYRLTDVCMVVLPYLAAGSMMVLGICRMAGRKPSCIFSVSICLFHMLMLVTNYRLWSSDPKFYDYAYPLLGSILLMLCSFHRTSCDAGIIQRKKLLFTGLTAAVCSTAALSVDFMPGFFLSSAFWALGCVCSPAVLPPDPEEETVEVPVEENGE